MGGYRFDYEEKVWGGETLRLSPVHFRASRLFYALQALKDTKGGLLDVGCGVGDFPEAIKHYYPKLEVYGIDISKKAISLARKRAKKVKFKVADVQKLPFKDETFEAVTCFDLLEHVENPQEALAEIYRVLKPGGIFHTFIPTEAELVSPEGVLIKLGWKAKEIYGGHPHHFTAGQVKKMLKKNHFQIVKARWGEHLVNQFIEIIYFSWLALRGKNPEHTVEGYLGLAAPSLKTSLLRIIKNLLASISYLETRLLWWFPGLGLHITCLKK
jgi:SAM-dependent methyltransferase